MRPGANSTIQRTKTFITKLKAKEYLTTEDFDDARAKELLTELEEQKTSHRVSTEQLGQLRVVLYELLALHEIGIDENWLDISKTFKLQNRRH